MARIAATFVPNSSNARRLPRRARFERQPDHGQWRHERDRDRDARESVGDIGSNQCERSDRARGQGGDEVDEVRADPSGRLWVGGGDDGLGYQQSEDEADRDHHGHAEDDQCDATQNPAGLAQHHGQRVPRIGVISGATIIGPMTVAVESATTPAPAMTAASTRRTQNADSLRWLSRKSRSVIRSMSAPVTSPGRIELDITTSRPGL